MIVAESRQGRRIIGRLDRGVDLIPALLEVCSSRGVRSGEVRALGALESAEVCEYDQHARVYRPTRRFAAAFEILSLQGNVSEKGGQRFLHAHVSLSRERDNGIEVLGGHLIGGRVFSVEFVIDAWDDLLLRRANDPATGLSLWQEAIPIPPAAASASVAAPQARPATPTPAPSPAAEEKDESPLMEFEARARGHVVETPRDKGPAWADVIATSEANQPPAAAAGEPSESSAGDADSMAAGDVLLHPTFGRCMVERIEGDYEFASIRLRNQRLVRLSLDVFDLHRSGSEDGKRVFKARVK